MEFSREKVKCSLIFPEDSCSMRDCTLDRYTIGGEEILTGGFCPLGNSETSSKPGVDYVALFHKLLEGFVSLSHLTS